MRGGEIGEQQKSLSFRKRAVIWLWEIERPESERGFHWLVVHIEKGNENVVRGKIGRWTRRSKRVKT